MRVLLVHPSALMYSEIFLRLEPLGLERVATALQADGHDVRLVDLQVYRQAKENGWLPADDDGALVSDQGTQIAALSYPHLGHTEILDSVDTLYRRFYFRAGKLAEMSAEMLRQPDMAGRRLREGGEFLRFLRRNARTPAAS